MLPKRRWLFREHVEELFFWKGGGQPDKFGDWWPNPGAIGPGSYPKRKKWGIKGNKRNKTVMS